MPSNKKDQPESFDACGFGQENEAITHIYYVVTNEADSREVVETVARILLKAG